MNFSYEEDSAQLLSKLEQFIPSAGADSVISDTVFSILADIDAHGDAAVQEKTLLFDGVSLEPTEFIVSKEESEASLLSISPAESAALKEAITNVSHFHNRAIQRTGYSPMAMA